MGVRKTEYKLVDQLVAHIVGGTDGGTMHMKGTWKERPLQNTSVTTHVEISRRVKRFKLDLGEKQEANGAPPEGGRYWLQNHREWGWSLGAMYLAILSIFQGATFCL